MNEENEIDQNPTSLEVEVLQTERTLATPRLCEGEDCGADLTGRRPRARFCGARCRTAHRRSERDGQLTNIITALENAIAALKTYGGGL